MLYRVLSTFNDGDDAICGFVGVYGLSAVGVSRELKQSRGRRHGLPLFSTADGTLQRFGGSRAPITWKDACSQVYDSCVSEYTKVKDLYVVAGNTTQSLVSLCGVDKARQAFVNQSDGNVVSGRIVGGQRADGDKYPYAMVLFDSEGPFCTGVVIDPSFALTAAHCIDDATVGVKIGVENWMLDDISGRKYTTRRIKKQFYHPDYDKMYSGEWKNLQPSGDIGIIQFDKPLENFTPPKIASSDKDIPKKLRVIGYGKTDEYEFDMSKVLREVDVELTSRKTCEKALNKEIKGLYGSGMKYKITDGVICAGSPKGKNGKDACQGDSGGPLFSKAKNPKDDVVYGITSFGEGCARKGVPGGYTNVAKYYNWIQKTISSGKQDAKGKSSTLTKV